MGTAFTGGVGLTGVDFGGFEAFGVEGTFGVEGGRFSTWGLTGVCAGGLASAFASCGSWT